MGKWPFSQNISILLKLCRMPAAARGARGMRKLVGKSLEYGDYMKTIKLDHRADKLTFHVFTAGEARRLLADRGLQAKVEKGAKFFL
jgi:hypothetical protein